MADWTTRQWAGSQSGPTIRERRSGQYRPYVPDALLRRPLVLSADLSPLAWQVESQVRTLGETPGAHGLEALARFLLRSEAIASSRIEGLEVSPQQVGLAEVAEQESLSARSVNATARRVASNITALRQATHDLAEATTIDVEGIDRLQRTLLPDEPRQQGIRDVQNWIGGSDYHPLDAEFVPPEPGLIPALMNDLVAYLNGGEHAPLIQAGLVHAQFETIHPFRDGNGRVGRALIHTVLVRRGLTRRAVLPVSPVLLTRSQEYVSALMAYRYSGGETGPEAVEAVSAWLRMFLRATQTAVEQAQGFATSLSELRQSWEQQTAETRRRRGVREVPRSDSAVARLLDGLHESPVLTSGSAARMLAISGTAAQAALDELSDAGILTKRRLDGRTNGYLAMDVFELITFAERRLASTRWDTSTSEPSRATPYRPQAR